MQAGDIYDIIIQNLTKEWENSMNNQLSMEKWETPKYSKKEINNAGKTIAIPTIEPEKRYAALEIVNN